MRRVAVTGILGNLGWKLTRHLAALGYPSVVGLEARPPAPGQLEAMRGHAQDQPDGPTQIEVVECDLLDWHDARWRRVLEQVDAVVHFAAQNPYPEATWDESNASFDMTLNLAHAAADAGVDRLVFATSNHVMGRYKDPPLSDAVDPGQLHTDLETGVGTLWHTGEQAMDSTVYAVAKNAGERLCRALGARAQGQTTFACIRIGWCQPGDNSPKTLSAAGTPTQSGGPPQGVDPDEYCRADDWYKQMWLSNADFLQLFEKAIAADGKDWPGGSIIVNGMSANTGMKWDLTATKKYLGYEPQDNSYTS
jgi:nucleoside-diphosphate-sugar epimerase